MDILICNSSARWETVSLSLSLFSPSYVSFPRFCPTTSQPFLRRFESRASRRNALMRTWLPSHFPPSSSRATPTTPTTMAAVTITVATLGSTEHQKREMSGRWGSEISLTRRALLELSFSLSLSLELHDIINEVRWIIPHSKLLYQFCGRNNDHNIFVIYQ